MLHEPVAGVDLADLPLRDGQDLSAVAEGHRAYAGRPRVYREYPSVHGDHPL